MELFESMNKDGTILQSTETEDTYLIEEWSYIISSPVWFPVSILSLVVFLAFGYMVNRIIKYILQKSKRKSPSQEKIISLQPITSTEEENVSDQAMQIREVGDVSCEPTQIREEERNPASIMMPETIAKVPKTSEHSEANKYLGTGLSENKISARKPIRSTELPSIPRKYESRKKTSQ